MYIQVAKHMCRARSFAVSTMGKFCAALDVNGPCKSTVAPYRLTGKEEVESEVAESDVKKKKPGFAARATYLRRGNFGGCLSFDFGNKQHCFLCAEHTLQVLSQLYAGPLAGAKANKQSQLTDLAVWLDFSGKAFDEERGYTAVFESRVSVPGR